jgi:hypothetical protein
MAAPLHEQTGLAVGAVEAGWILDPAVDQFLQTPLGVMVQHSGPAQRVEVAIGVEPKLRGSVVAIGEGLAGIAQGLEVADRFGVLK